jgi:hypothetical protein
MAASSAPVLAFLGITLNPLTLAADIANAIFSAALALFGKGAASLVGALLGFVKTTSDPVFSGGWWSSSGMAVFERVLAVSGSLLALAFMCSIITALLSADHGLLARAALRLPIAVLEMALLVGVTAALVSASDEISAEIARGASGPLSTFVSGELAGAIAGTGIVGLIAGGLVILAALGIWAELLCRSALIYLAVLAGPLIFAASVHPSAVGLRRRYVEGGLALICSKIVVALALATGSAMLSGLGHSSSFAAATGALLEALAVLLVACFAPFVLLRLLLGAEAIIAAEGLERRPARAALSTIGAASSVGGFSSMARGLTGAGAPPPGGGSPGSPPTGASPSGPPSTSPPRGPTSPRPAPSRPSGSEGAEAARPSSHTAAPPRPSSSPQRASDASPTSASPGVPRDATQPPRRGDDLRSPSSSPSSKRSAQEWQ